MTPLALLLLSPPALLLRAPMGAHLSAPISSAPLQTQRRVQPSVRMMLEDDPPPPEVIEAEANATPNRKYRVIGASVGFGIALFSGALSFAVLLGQPDALALSDLVLFDNAPVSLFINLLVGGTCAWAFQQEQINKRDNIQKIWDEVKRRRSGGAASPGGNRSQRRSKKVAVPGGAMPGAGGFGAAAARPKSVPRPAPPSAPPPPPAPSQKSSETAGAPSGPSFLDGALEKAGNFFEEANAIGKASALSLNAQLEDAGVLDKLPRTDEAATANDSAKAPIQGLESTAVAGETVDAAVSTDEAPAAAATTDAKPAKGTPSKKGKKRRKGKKGKK